MESINHFSLSSLRLTVFDSLENQVNLATGFFYRNSKDELFIVTNWHVVTGRHPKKPKYSPTGAIPTKMVFNLPVKNKPPKSKHPKSVAFKLSKLLEFEIGLNSKDGNSPEWLEHPKLRYHVDVVAIPIKKDGNEILDICVFTSVDAYPQLEPRFTPSVMDSVFVVGYPWGLTGGGPLPIFKRGSIASEPLVPHGNLPRVLIDCRTAPSMSGSPVIASHSGIWSPVKGEGPSLQDMLGTVENFLGVYSGRLIEAEFDQNGGEQATDLGIVWHQEALREVVNSGVCGTTLDEITAGK